jgi:glutamate racemase
MATRSTLASTKFRDLLRSLDNQTEFICQPCDGLAAAIEHADTALTQQLCAEYTAALGRFGSDPDTIDTLVLGCTHYPFAHEALQALVGPHVQLIDSGAPVARQTRRVLQARNALAEKEHGALELYTSSQTGDLEAAALRWLGLEGKAQVRLI